MSRLFDEADSRNRAHCAFGFRIEGRLLARTGNKVDRRLAQLQGRGQLARDWRQEIVEAPWRANSNQFRTIHGHPALPEDSGAFLHCTENCLRRPASAVEIGKSQLQNMRGWRGRALERNFAAFEHRDRLLRLRGEGRKDKKKAAAYFRNHDRNRLILRSPASRLPDP